MSSANAIKDGPDFLQTNGTLPGHQKGPNEGLWTTASACCFGGASSFDAFQNLQLLESYQFGLDRKRFAV